MTLGLGFLALAGDAKVRLTSKWDTTPAPTASLLSIASRKGLFAAAGPDAVVIGTTESVRKAFEAPRTDSDVRSYEPQAKLPLPFRISQLAFTADEKYLILSAETGGGLAVYDVQDVVQGKTDSKFQLATNGESLRALVPNPAVEFATYCALVTEKGNLLMANVAEGKLVEGASGPVLRTQVSCAAWSTRGKQLVAGMGDGSISQMTPEGVDKGRIPKSPGVGDYHVSSITWLENHVFLAVYSAKDQDSIYNIITRQQPPGGAPPTFTFQELDDPIRPFQNDKIPHHSILRLKDFPPNLQDLLVVSSTAIEDIGLLSRSKTALASNKPADKISNVFTMTELADDSRRAQVPMAEDMGSMDTAFPIGTALDLSGKDKVYRPIPAESDAIEFSPGPLPGLWALNNEGVLGSWWIIYNESIRAGATYPGLLSTGDVSTQPATSGAPAPAFASSAATPSPFGAQAAASPAFGGASALGNKPSPWATTPSASTAPAFGSSTFGSKPAAPAFGQSGFGSPSAAPSFGTPSLGAKAAAPAFGQSSMLGMGAKTSPWATGGTAAAQPAFGSSSLGSASPTAGKVFGSAAPASPGGGFASFASKGGFGSLGAAPSGTTNVFGSGSGAFSKPATEVSTAFPPQAAKTETKPAFGSSPFVLGTTFQPAPKSKDEDEPKGTQGGSLFSSGFGLSLSDAAKQPAAPPTKEEDMDSTPAPTPASEKAKSIFSMESTTPTTTPAPQRFDFKTTAGPTANSSLFGSKPATSSGLSNIFGTPKPAASSIFGTPKIKKEDGDKENLANIPAAPLPPDTTSKAVFPLGDSSSSSGSSSSPDTAPKTAVKALDAPLPPDFMPKKNLFGDRDATPKPEEKPKVVPEAAPLPPDFISKPKSKPSEVPLDFPEKALPKAPEVPAVPEDSGSAFSEDEGDEEEEEEGEEREEEEEEGDESGSEGSGIDVTKDLSPTTATGFSSHTPGGPTPSGSFTTMAESGYSTISRSEAEPTKLFGEVGRGSVLFPKPVPPQSPRSPSPVRPGPRTSIIARPDSHRSFSAPGFPSASGMASSLLGRKPLPGSGLGSSVVRAAPPIDPNVEEQRKLAAKKEAQERVLVDPEDESIQRILRSQIQPTLHMDEFLAVDAQLAPVNPSGTHEEIPVACETLWRDINRMIDRLGLNSRSLQAFIQGHSTMYKESGRHKEDLENPGEWVLVEGEDLGAVLDTELTEELKEGRIKNVEQVQASIQTLMRDLSKLRAKDEDLRRIISTQTDPDKLALAKSFPLSAEQTTQQNELRKSYAEFSKLLNEAEQALTMLKAKLATVAGASGKAPVPTVEAIIRTINKMTAVAEKRSGDIDVLENQMRRLRMSSVGLGGTPGPRSREGSPFATPVKGRASIFSPERSALRESTPGSYGMRGTPQRKKLSMFTDEEKAAIKAKAAKRKATLAILKKSLEKNGPNVTRLRDDD
ncbi:hypothetical protein OQA88_3579 [Cercophora sp. LCS_1]